jgi:hypothetical protein
MMQQKKRLKIKNLGCLAFLLLNAKYSMMAQSIYSLMENGVPERLFHSVAINLFVTAMKTLMHSP